MHQHSVSLSLYGRVMRFALAVGLLAGCGGKDEAPQASQMEPGASLSMEQNVAHPALPATVEVLRAMPSSATLAAVLPSISSFYSGALDTAHRLAFDPASVDAYAAQLTSEWGNAYGVPGAAAPPDIFTGRGIDIAKPIALYADISRLDPATLHALMGALGMDVDAYTGATALGKNIPSEASAPVDWKPLAAKADWAVSMPVTDAKEAEALLLGIFKVEGQEPATPSDAPGLPKNAKTYITPDMEFTYCTEESRMIFGAPARFVAAVVAGMHTPRTDIAYGTQECPVEEPGEAVALLNSDALVKVVPVLSFLSPLTSNAPASTQEYTTLTLAFASERMELLGRAPMAANSGMLAKFGAPGPLHMAASLPADTQAVAAFRISPELRQYMQGGAQGAISPEKASEPGMQQAMGVLTMVSGLVDGELALGLKADAEGAPCAVAKVGLANAALAKSMLQLMGVSPQPLETFEGVEILRAQPGVLPNNQDLYCAIAENTLCLATSQDDMHELLRASDGGSRLFESLNPPLDPEAQRYGLLAVRGSLFTDMLIPLLRQQGTEGEPEAGLDELASWERVGQNIRELRITDEAQNGWMRGSATIFWNKPA